MSPVTSLARLNARDSWHVGQEAPHRLKGPFRLWEHTHAFEERPDGTLIRRRQ